MTKIGDRRTRPYPIFDKHTSVIEMRDALRLLIFTVAHRGLRAVHIDRHVRDVLVDALTLLENMKGL